MGEAPACRRALADASEMAPKRKRAKDGIMGDKAHQARKSDHNVGNAVDITDDPVNGCSADEIAQLAMSDPRTSYIIRNRRIWNQARKGEGWRPYNGDDPHVTHVHISILASKRNDVSPWPWHPSRRGLQVQADGSAPAPGRDTSAEDPVLIAVVKWGQANGLTRDVYAALAAGASAAGMPLALIVAQCHRESEFQPNAMGRDQDTGLMQVLPSTGRPYLKPGERLIDPQVNARIGAAYLMAQYGAFGSFRLALLAYNRGPNAVRADLLNNRNPSNGYDTAVFDRLRRAVGK